MRLNEIKPLFEGGNIFKGEDKQPVTIRINKADVDPSLEWLEKIVRLPLTDNKLGSTGKKATSGDLDVAIDDTKITKDELVGRLMKWVEKNHPDDNPKDWVRKSGISVHFKHPIRGDEDNGFVQTDLMFGDPEWMKFGVMGSDDTSKFKGVHRQLMLASIAKAQGMKWSSTVGLTDRESGDVISKEPDKIAKTLLGNKFSSSDLDSIEKIVKAIKGRKDYEELVADARKAFERDELTLP